MPVRFAAVPFLLAACVMSGFVLAFSQAGRASAAQPQTEAFSDEGVIESVTPVKMQFVTAGGRSYVVAITPQTTVEYTATAAVDALRVGMAVRFTAPMNMRGVVTQKVAQLTVYTPSKNTPPLAFWSADPNGAVGGGVGFGDTFDAAKPAGKPAGKPAAKPAPLPDPDYVICGRVTSFHVGKRQLQLATTNAPGPISAEVAADAKIDVNLADCSLAQGRPCHGQRSDEPQERPGAGGEREDCRRRGSPRRQGQARKTPVASRSGSPSRTLSVAPACRAGLCL